MKKIKILIIGLLMIIIAVINGTIALTTVQAVPTKEEVYENAPKGLNLDDFMLVPSSYKYDSGTATIPSSGSKIYDNPKYPTDIIQLISKDSPRPTQIGSLWGNINTDGSGNRTYNYFDLSRKQEVSAWIYNGDSDASGHVIDGFAFVLQNDSLKDQAISRRKGIPVGGETLGVWGTNNSLGIQNSVAIEFDRIANQANTAAGNLDSNNYSTPSGIIGAAKSMSNKHISWNYPGLLNSYTGTDVMIHKRTPSSLTNNIYMSGYDGVSNRPGTTTVDPKDAWRHIKINYTPPAAGTTVGKLEYKFNDKYQDGTDKGINSQDRGSMDIDTSYFNAPDNKVYWGFTAATGSVGGGDKDKVTSGPADVAMVIEKMPAIVDLKSDVVLTDLNNNETSTITTPVETYDGDDLKFEYTLEYTGGISETGEVKTKMALPDSKYVDYAADSDGNIGAIIYTNADGSVTKQVPISASQLEDMVVTVPGATADDPPTEKTIKGLNLTIDTIKTLKNKVSVDIYGKAKSPANDKVAVTKVSSEHTAYQSDNYTGDVMSPTFTINNDALEITNTNDLDQTLTVNDEAVFQGTIKHSKDSIFDEANNLVATIQSYDQNGKPLKTYKDTTTVVKSGATQGNFDISAPLTGLAASETYTFKVTFSDDSKRVSNTLIYTVKVEENKKLVITKKDFQKYVVVEKGNALALNVNLAYEDGKSNVDSTKIKTYLKIDDGEYTEAGVADEQNAKIIVFGRSIDTSTLTPGEHTLSVYANEQKENSNILEYTFKVVENGLTLTSAKEVINVKNNNPVTLNWNVAYNDEVDDGSQNVAMKVKQNTLQIKNEGDTEFRDFDIYINKPEANDPSFAKPVDNLSKTPSFELNPIRFQGGNSQMGLLKEGRNEIRFSVKSNGLTSNVVTVYVDVPHLTLQLASPTKDLYTTSVQGSILLDYSYDYLEDQEYLTDLTITPTQLLSSYELNGQSSEEIYAVKQDDINDKNFKSRVWLGEFSGLKVGNDYSLKSTIRDPYNRKSAPYEFNLHIVDKYTKLNVDDAEFKDIGPLDKVDSYIHRQGLWNISVTEVGTKWDLTAQSDGLSSTDYEGYHKDLIFMDANKVVHNLQGGSEIASQDVPIKNQDQTTNLAKDWSDDEGILLVNQKPDLSGEYQGQINWLLKDVPE